MDGPTLITSNGDGIQAKKSVTVSQVLGEICWLVSQSDRHSAFTVRDLCWFVMPAISLRQFHIFRDGARPIGVALWAFPSGQDEVQLSKAPVSPTNKLPESAWHGGESLWLIDLVAPFATDANHQFPLMLGDLMTGPFREREFRMLSVDRQSGDANVRVIAADAGLRLAEEIRRSATVGAVR